MSIEAAFTGICCRDPELKTAQSGKAFCSFTLGVGEGDGRQWVRVVCFEDTAEKVAQQLRKGGKAYCEGFLEIDLWEPDGKPPRINVNCRARRVEILNQIGRNKPGKTQERRTERSTGHRHPQHERPFEDDPFGYGAIR
jgi:single-stranded DNA-binding protein